MTSYSANCLFPLKRMSSSIPNIHVLTGKKNSTSRVTASWAAVKSHFPLQYLAFS